MPIEGMRESEQYEHGRYLAAIGAPLPGDAPGYVHKGYVNALVAQAKAQGIDTIKSANLSLLATAYDAAPDIAAMARERLASLDAARVADLLYGADHAPMQPLDMIEPADANAARSWMLPGTMLPNGAVVVAASAAHAHRWIVLAMRPGFHASGTYATWTCSRPGDGRDTTSGHYSDTIHEAAKDYATRCERGY